MTTCSRNSVGSTGRAVAAADEHTGSFTGLDIELTQLLEVKTIPISEIKTGGEEILSSRKLLKGRDPTKQYLPGQPRIRLEQGRNAANPSQDEILDYLRKAHLTDELDQLLPFMKYIFVQTPSYRHIMPLHHQSAHARVIKVNEQPGLHLVWYYEHIFIKPIPAYFYSNAFWTYLSEADPLVHRAAVGFMRSYYFLIQYEIDYDEACRLKLIPRKPDGDGAHPSYEEFCRFIEPFSAVKDVHICRRYHYGELRLTRINRTALVFKFRLAYFHIYPQWGSYLTHILAPVITVFAVASVVLNCMQVTLAAQQMQLDSGGGSGASDSVPIDDGWLSFISVATYFPVAVMISIALVLAVALFGVLTMGMKDLIWAKTVRQKKKHGDPNAGEKSHGLVW